MFKQDFQHALLPTKFLVDQARKEAPDHAAVVKLDHCAALVCIFTFRLARWQLLRLREKLGKKILNLPVHKDWGGTQVRAPGWQATAAWDWKDRAARKEEVRTANGRWRSTSCPDPRQSPVLPAPQHDRTDARWTVLHQWQSRPWNGRRHLLRRRTAPFSRQWGK